MTTIVATLQGMASDSRTSDGMPVEKVIRVSWGLIGLSGDLQFALRLVHWLKNPRTKFPEAVYDDDNEERDDCAEVIILRRGKGISTLDQKGIELKTTSSFWAVGTGKEYALGSMEERGDPIRAVEVAAKYASGTKLPVVWYPLERSK